MRVLPRLIRFLGAHRGGVAVAVLLGVSTMASNIGLLSLAAFLIAAAALKPALVTLSVPIYLVRLCGVSRGFARYGERMVSHSVTFRLLTDLRTWFYERLEPLAPARLLEHRSGDLLDRIVQDVDELQNIYLRIFSPILVAAVTVLATFALFYIFSPLLAFVALGFLLAAGIGVPLLVNALASGLGRRQISLRSELNAQLVDGIQGVQDILAFGAASNQQEKVSRINREISRTQRRMALIGGLQNSLADLLANLAVVTLLVLAVPLVGSGAIRGVYLAFLALVILSSFEAITPLGDAFRFLGRSLESGRRLFEVVDAEPDVKDPADPITVPEEPGLEFRNVSFSYREGEPPALEDVSFELAPGSHVAVVGPSGAGKSTLTRLALRFWDRSSGEVRVGERDVRGYAQEELRERMGLVAQDTHIFNGTLRYNLLLARPDATEAKLARALETAQLDDFVESLPKGLDSWVGEQGLRLSGGERQRLAVARALLKDAPLLILDEPTANLDAVTEAELMSAIEELMRERATLLITHRLVGLERMDEILVLDEGRVAERGTHTELMRAGGLYSRMVEVQREMIHAA